ncbi:MAG TPA: cyclase family protein [Phototrophicaceae bacterium]|nr:cyclase family protein [Phototrophicaceae bacterium]
MLYDITRTVSATTAVFPGDTPYSTTLNWDIRKGSSVNLTTITTTPHVGTHADAYFHYLADGEHPAQMPLEPYIGRARVVSTDQRSGELVVSNFPAGSLDGIERLLIHTWVSDVPDDQWVEDFPYPSLSLMEALGKSGVKLLGLDVSSMDKVDSKDLPSHHALKQYGMVNLENVLLRGVPDGDYELIALPLKLDAACGSPVRAVLRSL